MNMSVKLFGFTLMVRVLVVPLSGFQATSCSTPSDAIHRFLRFLYAGQPPPNHPLSGETPKQKNRNEQIRREHPNECRTRNWRQNIKSHRSTFPRSFMDDADSLTKFNHPKHQGGTAEPS